MKQKKKISQKKLQRHQRNLVYLLGMFSKTRRSYLNESRNPPLNIAVQLLRCDRCEIKCLAKSQGSA